MEFNWVKIGNCDWKCELANGGLLRAEKMSSYYWWPVYAFGEECHSYYCGSFPTNSKDAKSEAEKAYKKAATIK